MRTVFLLVFFVALPGEITSNPLPDVDAGKTPGQGGLSAIQGVDVVVGPTLEAEDQGLPGDYGLRQRVGEDGVVAGRSIRLSWSAQSGDVSSTKAVVDIKSFEVSSGNDADVNILAGSKVLIKIHPEPFQILSTDTSNPSKLKLDLICPGNGEGSSAEFGFYRDDRKIVAKMYVAGSSVGSIEQTENTFFDFIFVDGKVITSRISVDDGDVLISFKASKCRTNSDEKNVWRAKVSTSDSKVYFKVEIESIVVSTVLVLTGKTVGNKASTAAAGVPLLRLTVIALGVLALRGLLLRWFSSSKDEDVQDKPEEGEGQAQQSKTSQKEMHVTTILGPDFEIPTTLLQV